MAYTAIKLILLSRRVPGIDQFPNSTITVYPGGGGDGYATPQADIYVRKDTTDNNDLSNHKPVVAGRIFKGFWTSETYGEGDQVFDSDMKYVPGTYWTADGKWTKESIPYGGGGRTYSLYLYAQWQYALTVDPNGGTFNGSTSVATYTAVIGDGARSNLGMHAPTCTGYSFLGWFNATSGGTKVYDTNNKCVSGTDYFTDSYANGGKWKYYGDLTVYARWNPNTYTVVFNKNSSAATGTMANQSFNYDEQKQLSANAFSWTGRHFSGWATSANGAVVYSNSQSVENLSSTNGGTVNLYAKWDVYTYTVVFNKNSSAATGTMANQSFSYDQQKPLSANAFSWTGRHFSGWATSANGAVVYSNSQSVENLSSTNGGTVNLYAKWAINTYTVVFNKNSSAATGTMANQSFNYDEQKQLSANAFSWTGHLFDGWNRVSDGSGASYGDFASVKNLSADDGATVTLYAQWRPAVYNVSYSLDGGAFDNNTSHPEQAEYDSSFLVSAPKRAHYRFAGWKFSGCVEGQAAWKTTSGSSWTAITNGSTQTNAGATAAINLKNLHTTEGATVTLLAQWERISYSITIVNTFDGSLRLTSNERPNYYLPIGVGTAVPYTAYAGENVTVTLEMRYARYAASFTHYVPYSVGGYVFSLDSTAENPLTVAANEGNGAVFSTSHAFGDSEDATQTWACAKKEVTVTLGTVPFAETSGNLIPTFAYSTDPSIQDPAPCLVVVAYDQDEGNGFDGWSAADVSPSSALLGTSIDGGTAYIDLQTDTTLTANYSLKRTDAYASIHAKSSPIALSGGVTVKVAEAVYDIDDELAVDWSEATNSCQAGFAKDVAWKIDIPQAMRDAGYGFGGWYNSADGKVSEDEVCVLSNVRADTTLYAKLSVPIALYKRAEEIDLDSKVDATSSVSYGTSAGNTTSIMIFPCSFSMNLGDRLYIVAQADNENSHFAGWYDYDSTNVLGALRDLGATDSIEIDGATSLVARFTAQSNVYHVVLCSRLVGTTNYGEYGSFVTNAGIDASDNAVSGGNPDIKVETRAAFVAATGTQPPDGGDDSYAVFLEVTNMQRLLVSVTQGPSSNYGFARVKIRRLSVGASETTISTQPTFSSVVNANYAYIAEWGNVTMKTLTVRTTLSSAGRVTGQARVGSRASNITIIQKYGEKVIAESGRFEKNAEATAYAFAENGWKFSGWYDNASYTGDPLSTAATYKFAMPNADKAIYAKFERAEFALYRWEGGSELKTARWKSKVYALSKPASMVCVRVDAATIRDEQPAYPVTRFKLEAFSAPDTGATGTADLAYVSEANDSRIKDDKMRRLPSLRPERYFTVCVENDAEVDAIAIGTSGEEIAK